MIVIKKGNLIIISVMLITVITLFICLGAIFLKPTNITDANAVKVVLDAGHGGVDNGVSGIATGVKESELNLKVVKKLETFFVSAGISVVLTRDSEAGLYDVANSSLKKKDMLKRKQIIERAKPTLVISIHMNKYSLSTRRGAQVFYKQDSDNSKILANSVQKSLNLMPEASRECKTLAGDYYILNCTDYPSIICECGFLSNPEDEALLITDAYQDSIAYAIFCGVVDYFSQTSFNFFS
ncbi:MAG: N-acetylmuramoyl-L-alanine amidase [Clostridiales bacterium]|nr:N-acetylmuramoyl-L-alanine amidase [Clostridiales bacterium]